MNIKEVLNSKVLDKNAYEVGTVTDFDIDQKEGTINSMIVSLKKGVFSKEELEVPFEDIETIGGYVILAKELPKPEEAEEEVEAQKEVVAEDIASAESAPVALQAETIAAPLKGEVVALENVNDPVFSSGAMGKGAAIKPSGNQVVAPFDGEVQIAFPTGHAYGLKSDKGAEVLIHIGIDTVSLDGKGFDAKVQANQRIKKGDVLATFDSSVITEAGLDDTTMVIVTNTADFEDVSSVANGSVAEGADFIAVK